MQTQTIVKCDTPTVDHLEKHGFLFGYPIAHSLSPIFHQTIFAALGLSWDYMLLPSTDMETFLQLVRDPRLYGSGVTMPNKVAILPHLDELSPECRDVGACNTVFFRNKKLMGANTDVVGVRESFYQNVADPDSTFHYRPALVVGGGGAARSAVYALVKSMRCTKIYLVNRDAAEVRAVISWCKSHGYGDNLTHVATVEQAESLEGPGAIVACVPNFTPSTEAEKLARRITEVFLEKSHKGAILEMCYHPTPFTEIGAIAESKGWQVILGTEAMIYQGFEQARLWTGRTMDEFPLNEVKAVIASEVSKARL